MICSGMEAEPRPGRPGGILTRNTNGKSALKNQIYSDNFGEEKDCVDKSEMHWRNILQSTILPSSDEPQRQSDL